jgi:hypothetical protein
LIRIGYGPFDLGKVAPGYAEEVPVRQLPQLLPGYFASGGVLPARRIVVARDR